MNTSNKKNRKSGVKAAVLSALLVIGFGSVTNSAMAFTVYDPTNWIQNMLDQIQSKSSWATQAKDMVDNLNKLQAQYDALMSQMSAYEQMLQFQSNFPVDLKSMKRNDLDGVADRCPGSGNLSLGSLLGFRLNPHADLLETQTQICQLVVVAENRRFNNTIDMMSKLEDRSKEYQRIQNQARGNQTPGQIAANDNALSQLGIAMEQDLKEWEMQDMAYESYIGQMQRTQQVLASQAMSGRRSSGLTGLINAAKQGLALETALQLAK